jgi:hypothetical protein
MLSTAPLSLCLLLGDKFTSLGEFVLFRFQITGGLFSCIEVGAVHDPCLEPVTLRIIWPNFLRGIWHIGATSCPTDHKAFGCRVDPSTNSFVTCSSQGDIAKRI